MIRRSRSVGRAHRNRSSAEPPVQADLRGPLCLLHAELGGRDGIRGAEVGLPAEIHVQRLGLERQVRSQRVLGTPAGSPAETGLAVFGYDEWRAKDVVVRDLNIR